MPFFILSITPKGRNNGSQLTEANLLEFSGIMVGNKIGNAEALRYSRSAYFSKAQPHELCIVSEYYPEEYYQYKQLLS